MAFTGAMLPTSGTGLTSASVAEKPKAAIVPAADHVARQAASGTGAYVRFLPSFQVISSVNLEEVANETSKKPSVRAGAAGKVKLADGFTIGMTAPNPRRGM